ncbi:YjfB family protein [Clostridium sp. Marseille-P2415]|uniref:YjfB family protein n=1 Tax=Clostridium sp. Marseille-P2415 TaxID=1805471 RepID=UPI000988693D|nr:YjfB family protein [Clostridium sp. Marseille-P2415]
MDIAAMSMEMSSVRLQQSVGMSVIKKAMNSEEAEAAGLLEMADTALPQQQVPSDGVGQIMDARA